MDIVDETPGAMAEKRHDTLDAPSNSCLIIARKGDTVVRVQNT